ASGWHPPIHSLLQPRTNQNKTKRPESSAIPYSGLGRLICNRPTSGGQFSSRPCHFALGFIHHKPQGLLEIGSGARHDALARATAAHIDVAVIGISAERQPSGF